MWVIRPAAGAHEGAPSEVPSALTRAGFVSSVAAQRRERPCLTGRRAEPGPTQICLTRVGPAAPSKERYGWPATLTGTLLFVVEPLPS